MPTYKNNTESRIADQDIAFDSGQEKTAEKILVEEIILVTNIAGAGVDFAVGDVVTGGTSGAVGTILRYDTEDDILELINRNLTEFGPIEVVGPPLVPGEEISTGSGGTLVTADLVSKKTRLTKVAATPYFNPVVSTDISTVGDGDDVTVFIDIDKTEAIIILRNSGSHDISLNVAVNVVARTSADNDEYMVETDGEVQSVILTQVGAAAEATVLQFSSREAAYRFFD